MTILVVAATCIVLAYLVGYTEGRDAERRRIVESVLSDVDDDA